ncbi:rab11 family-interacting protein 3-like [Garra rufa]|uniref:rab11 family-interacting protein 3-like n=1 Tax=Garra rufa TaxID=137080 RepID=UPI003CCE9C06
MEQVLSSPQGCSEWEVSGKAEWESEQDPLGFLLMDKDNTSVGDSTNEIFQENAINLDDLFWSSQYSGQTYSWENGLECVYPEWKTQPAPSQDLKGEHSTGSLEIVDGDLICFNSRSASPTVSNVQAQNQNTFYNLPEQVPDFLQPVEIIATSNPLDVYTGELGITPTDKTLLQETHLLEDTHLTNCEFSHSSLEERTFVNNDSQSFHLSLESEGLLHVSPVELSCTDMNSNPKPSIICQFTPEHIYLPSSALPCELISPTTHTEPTVPSDHEGSAHLPMDEVEMLLPGLLVGGLHSASNETHDDDVQTQETTDANMETKQLSSEVETVCQTPLGESCISSELHEEIVCGLSTECTFDVLMETVGEVLEEEVVSNTPTDNVISEAETGLAPIAVVDLQAEDPSNESLLNEHELESISEHNALLELSSENKILPEDHNQPTSSIEADASSEVPHDGDIPDSTFEILTDTISCEAVPSLLDTLITPVTEQDQCDANPPDFESNLLTLEFQDKADALSEVPHGGDISDFTFEILQDRFSCEVVPSLDSVIPPVTKQDKCDANSPDIEFSSLTLKFQDKADTLSEVPHNGDIPDSMLEILTDSISCEAVPSLLDSVITPVTEQDKCDANSPDLGSNLLNFEFKDKSDALFEVPLDGAIADSTFEILQDGVSCEAVPSLDSVSPPVTKLDKCDANSPDLESSSVTLEFQDKAEDLFEVPDDGDIPDSLLKILTDSVSCEAVPSLLDSLITPVTEQDKCDANSPDLESNSLNLKFQDEADTLFEVPRLPHDGDIPCLPHDGDIPDSMLEILTDSVSCEAELSLLDSVITPVTEQDKCNANSPDLGSNLLNFEFQDKFDPLFEVSHDGDIPDSTFEILQDSVSCEPVPSLDSVFPPVTDQDKCDANSPDLESNSLTLEFQDNLTNVEADLLDAYPEAVETQQADDTPTVGNTVDSGTLKVLEISDLHQNQEASNLQIVSLNLDNSEPDNQELNAMSETCQEQVNMLLDQLNDSLIANSSAVVIDTPEENVTAHNNSHNTPLNAEEKLHSVSLQGGERSDYSMSTQNQVIPHCESNPDSLESTPFTCAGDQLTVTAGRVGPDLSETTESPGQLCEAIEGEAGFPAQEDFHQLTPSQIDLAQEQQVSSVAPSSPPSHRNVFPCGASLDGEAYLTLMENNPDTPNIPKHAEMTLDLCKASDALPTKSLHDQRVPVDLINVPIVHKSEEQSALRAVFQALDQDGDGFVHIEEFVEFAKAYGAEQVKDLTRFLDPSGLGVISFEDFHRGISAISNEGSDPDLYKTHLSAVEGNGPPEEYDEQAEVSDSAYLGSESAYSECETFTDEDTTAMVHPELHEDVETDSGIENTLTDGDDRNRFTLGSDLNGHTLVAVIGGEEEHFEDFGESNNTSDLLLANQEDGGAGPEGEGDAETLPLPGSPLPRPLMLLSPSPSSFPASFQSFLQSEALEFFCTHCHKQISRLEDLSTRLQLLEMNSSSKRMSSKKAARHLQQSGTLDAMGDLTQDILDLADRDITDKVR